MAADINISAITKDILKPLGPAATEATFLFYEPVCLGTRLVTSYF
jgi:hypothetical protein